MGVLVDVKKIARSGAHFYAHFAGSFLFDLWTKATSTEALRKRQLRKFRRLLHHAYEHVDFYRDRLDSVGLRPEDIQHERDILRIPLLTKDDIRANFPDRMIWRNRKVTPDRIGRSSGTTSEAVHFICSHPWKRSIYMGMLRMQRWWPARVAVLTTPQCSGTSCSIRKEPGTLRDKVKDVLVLTRLEPRIHLPSSLNVVMESDDYFYSLLQLVRRYRPRYFLADPVYLAAFARYLKTNKIRVPGIRGIMTSYEMLQTAHRKLLEEVFGCEVYTQYGCSELNDIANECRFHRLHLRMDTAYAEFIWQGRPVGPGVLGKIVVTDLDNLDMPLIRYELGDLGRWSDEECPCGRKTLVLADVEGRVVDLLRLADGDVVTPRQVDNVMSELERIAGYQVVQRGYDDVDVSFLSNGAPPTPAAVDAVTTKLKDLVGSEARIAMREVPELLPERSHKYRFAYSDLTDPADEVT